MSGFRKSAEGLQRADQRRPPPRYTVPDSLVSQSEETPRATGDRAAAARILARSFYRELRENGYTARQLLSLSTELIELVTQDLQRERQEGVSVRVAYGRSENLEATS